MANFYLTLTPSRLEAHVQRYNIRIREVGGGNADVLRPAALRQK